MPESQEIKEVPEVQSMTAAKHGEGGER